MHRFTLHIFDRGREFQFHGVMPDWLQRNLEADDFLSWYGFLKGTRQQVVRLDREHPRTNG